MNRVESLFTGRSQRQRLQLYGTITHGLGVGVGDGVGVGVGVGDCNGAAGDSAGDRDGNSVVAGGFDGGGTSESESDVGASNEICAAEGVTSVAGDSACRR